MRICMGKLLNFAHHVGIWFKYDQIGSYSSQPYLGYPSMVWCTNISFSDIPTGCAKFSNFPIIILTKASKNKDTVFLTTSQRPKPNGKSVQNCPKNTYPRGSIDGGQLLPNWLTLLVYNPRLQVHAVTSPVSTECHGVSTRGALTKRLTEFEE